MRHQRIVPAVLMVVMVLAGGNWILRPDHALRWLRAMVTLPGLWLAITLWQGWTLRSLRRRGIDDESAVRRYSGSVIALVFLAVGLMQIVILSLQGWVEIGHHPGNLGVERRILGLAASAVFIIVGNTLPKILTPLSMLSREQAQLVTVARRFVGSIAVILGLLTALAFMSAPVAIATAFLRWATAAGLLTMVVAVVWMNVSAARRGA